MLYLWKNGSSVQNRYFTFIKINIIKSDNIKNEVINSIIIGNNNIILSLDKLVWFLKRVYVLRMNINTRHIILSLHHEPGAFRLI